MSKLTQDFEKRLRESDDCQQAWRKAGRSTEYVPAAAWRCAGDPAATAPASTATAKQPAAEKSRRSLAAGGRCPPRGCGKKIAFGFFKPAGQSPSRRLPSPRQS